MFIGDSTPVLILVLVLVPVPVKVLVLVLVLSQTRNCVFTVSGVSYLQKETTKVQHFLESYERLGTRTKLTNFFAPSVTGLASALVTTGHDLIRVKCPFRFRYPYPHRSTCIPLKSALFSKCLSALASNLIGLSQDCQRLPEPALVLS